MREIDGKATIDEIRAISDMLGTPLPPRVIAEDADALARAANVPKFLDPIPNSLDSLEVVHEKMFLSSFFDKFTSIHTDISEHKSRAEEFLDTFDAWKDNEIQRLGIEDSTSSQAAYRIVLRLSIADTVRFAEQQRRLYETKHNSNGYFMSEYEYFRQREDAWNNLHLVASHAQTLGSKRKGPRK